MSFNYQYLSVVTPPVTPGNLSIQVQTYTFSSTDTGSSKTNSSGYPDTFNNPVISLFTLNVSGVTGSEDEIGLATIIYNQLGTCIIQNGLNYSGFLAYAEEVYPATYQATRSDHCVCLWSQTLFTASIVTNTIGANIVINPSPVLLTLQEALDLAVMINFDYTANSGVTLTNDQIVKAMLQNSSFLTNRMRNKIVVSTYGKEISGNDTDTVTMYPYPVIDFDQPRIRRKNIVDVYNLPQWGKFAYGIVGNNRKGLKFRFSETLIDHREPFGKDNLVYLSFLSGHFHIPEEIKLAIVEFIRLNMLFSPELKSMKGGSGAFVFNDYTKLVEKILTPILQYKMRP